MAKQETAPILRSTIINKDRIPPLVYAYEQLLRDQGVRGLNLQRVIKDVEQTIYDGNPDVTSKCMARLYGIVTSSRIK